MPKFIPYLLALCCCGVTLLAHAEPAPWMAGPSATTPEHPAQALIVAQDGSGNFKTVQAAINAVPRTETHTAIVIKPGIYRETIEIGASKPPITLLGATGDPKDVVIVYDNASSSFNGNTPRSATATFNSDDLIVKHLTIANDFVPTPSLKNQQAVAVRAQGDRQWFENCRILARQDTVFADRIGPRHALVRQYFHNCLIEGDVDFIYGSATAVFDHCLIRSLDRNKDPNGYITAASTADSLSRGFLISQSRLESSAAAHSIYLGRPWHPSGDPRAISQVTIRESWLGEHIHPTGWTDMGGFKGSEARFFEYRNTGPGANNSRPQLDEANAAHFSIAEYLRGEDQWAPDQQSAPSK